MKTTFIMPVKIESHDRARNLQISVGYLLKNTDSKIIMKEVSNKSVVPQLLKDNIKSERITYLYEKGGMPFHRTKYLNDMLEIADTEIISNYDVDVLLPPEAYKLSEKLIFEGTYDVVYPYPKSDDGQVMLFFDSKEQVKNMIDNPCIQNALAGTFSFSKSYAGHCFFIKKEKYIQVGGENEEFISYGPEDSERITRFYKLGMRIGRLHSKVMHIEHVRTCDSDNSNPHYEKNIMMEKALYSMQSKELAEYYNNLEYVKIRKFVVLLK